MLTRRLVLPFHPMWNLGSLNRALPTCMDKDHVVFAWGQAHRSSMAQLAIRVAWSNGGRSLAALAEVLASDGVGTALTYSRKP